MTYTQAEQYIFSLMNIARKEYMNDPKHCKLYLKRVQYFLDLIGNPEQRLPHVIHVTGTSGKGSVCHILHNILYTAGHRTALLTSPHPTYITDRWVINGKPMSKRSFIAVVSRLQPFVQEYLETSPYDMVSFSELMTIIGFHYFSSQRVTHAVIEVGCGGRYDSTNILPKKDAAIITNIGLDHTTLWPTKKDIAIEKSGIIKQTDRVYTAEKNPAFVTMMNRAAQKSQATFTRYSPAKLRIRSMNTNGTTFDMSGTTYTIPAVGAHQAHNAGLAIIVARDLGIPEASITAGVSMSSLPIRMELVHRAPLVILDSAHNTDKIRTTIQSIQQMRQSHPGNIHLLVGFTADKALRPMTRLLQQLRPSHVTCTRQTTNIFRKTHDPRTIAAEFPGAKKTIYLDPIEALSRARQALKRHDILLITGSTFLAGELRPHLTI